MEMPRGIGRELRRWRYEWVPFIGFVLILASGFDDLAFWWPWLFAMVGFFALAWNAHTATEGPQQEELSIPARSQIVMSVAIGLVTLGIGVLAIFAPTGAGATLDKTLLLLLGAASGINLLKALALTRQRTVVRDHWENAHPGSPLPDGQ